MNQICSHHNSNQKEPDDRELFLQTCQTTNSRVKSRHRTFTDPNPEVETTISSYMLLSFPRINISSYRDIATLWHCLWLIQVRLQDPCQIDTCKNTSLNQRCLTFMSKYAIEIRHVHSTSTPRRLQSLKSFNRQHDMQRLIHYYHYNSYVISDASSRIAWNKTDER